LPHPKKIELKNITYGFQQSLTKPISFCLLAGNALHIRGPNGVGKSLLLKTIMGEHRFLSGELKNEFHRIAYLPQAQNRAAHLPFSLAEVANCANTKLLPEKLGNAWNTASGGERQRALLARCFSKTAELYILDEPFNHLDQSARKLVKETILTLPKEAAILLVSHEEDEPDWLLRPTKHLELEPQNE
jgi:ABC-type Mn2+/Zn2+ transport system ATPase subunit